MNAPPRPSAFFDRKRRLAYYFAWASMGFLFLELSIGFFLEVTGRPRAAASLEGFRLLHRALNPDDADGSRLLSLDPDGRLAGPSLNFPDAASALLPEGRDTTVFFGTHAALVSDGRIARSVDLKQKWDVLASVADPGGPWIFGWIDDHVVARRRDQEAWGPELVLAKSGEVDQVVASRDGTAGPLVAWHERGKTQVKVALWNGATFVPGADFEIGAVENWDLLLSGGRQILVLYHRDDRSYKYVTLRLQCCPGCASPLEPRKVRFSEPLLLLGRKVTGLSAVAAGERLRLFVTRMSTVMTASLPLPALEPDPAASRLIPISSQSIWRHLAAGLAPFGLVFCSFSMIFLGFVLFRERARQSAGAAPVVGPPIADFLPRAMAFLLDHILLAPVMILTAEVLLPEGGLLDFEDPNFQQVALVCLGQSFLYYFLMEWRWGWTIGKRIIGLRVTGADGSRLTLRGALVRTLIRMIDAESIPMVLVGTAAILLTKRRQRLGDLAARTIVVQDLPE